MNKDGVLWTSHLARVSIAKKELGRMLVDLPDFIDRGEFLDMLTNLGMWEQRLTRQSEHWLKCAKN